MGGFGPPRFNEEGFMNKIIPGFLFHEDCREGRIFYDVTSRNEALATGWVTGPHLIVPKTDPEPLPSEVPKVPKPKKHRVSKGKR